MARLTLSMDEAVVAKAKMIAKANRTSVSAMFSQFVESMSAAQGQPSRLGPLTRRLSGIVKLAADKDYRELLEEALMRKR